MFYCLLSPAKKMASSPVIPNGCTEPMALGKTQQLINHLKTMSPQNLSDLMGISSALATLNHQRFQAYSSDHRHHPHAGAALFQFEGDVYRFLDAHSLSEEELAFAANHVGILSGLYGLLRPFDLMLPYRLEMGTTIVTKKGRGLYQFWGETITQMIQQTASPNAVILNLASQEYARSVNFSCFKEHWTVVFKEQRGQSLKVVGVNAKRARGALTRWIIKQHVSSIEELMKAEPVHYGFHSIDEEKRELLFVRT